MSDPFGKYNGNELKYCKSFLEEGGDYVKELEVAFSNKLNLTFSIAVNSGTSALHAALVACDVRGGEVLMPALCPAMVAFAVIHAGATPVFCDVDPETHHIDLKSDSIQRADTTNIRAILGVSLHGLPIDWSPIAAIQGIASPKVWLIDDCAQALGAKGIGKADITCFSFEDKKHITSGSEGGMIATNNEQLAMRARKFAGLGYKHMTASAGRTSLAQSDYQDPAYERFDTIGLNYRMSQIQAAVGLGQLERLDHIVARRRAVAIMFARHIWSNPFNEIIESQTTLPNSSSFYTLPIKCKTNWKDFYNRFVSMGGDGFYAMPQVTYREPALTIPLYGSNAILGPLPKCPVAEDLQRKLMLFKTNYRNLGEAEKQAEILAKLIGEL